MESSSSGGQRSGSGLKATLASLLSEFCPERSEPGGSNVHVHVSATNENLHFKLLEEATKLLQRLRAESNKEIDKFRRSLDEKEAETINLKDRLRHQEERERTLVEENRALRVKIMGMSSSQKKNEISVPNNESHKVEVGVQVELDFGSSLHHFCSDLAHGHGAEDLEEDGFPFSDDFIGEEGVRIPASVLLDRFLKVRNFRRRKRRQLALEHPEEFQSQFEGYPRLRPIFQKKNGMKEGGEVVGYQWSHYTKHEFLRVNPTEPLPPDLLEEEEELEDDEGEVEIEEKEEEDDDEVKIIEEIGVPPKGPSTKEDAALDENKENLKQGNSLIIDVKMAEPSCKAEEEKDLDAMFQIKKSDNDSCMMTSCPYFVSEELEDHVSEVLAKPEKESFVEVPSWRKIQLEGLTRSENESMEEDVSEAAVLRRHSRLELDEKRRKRWDSQRVREETYLERLKRRMEERENQKTKRRKRKFNNSVPSKYGDNKDGNSDDESATKEMQGQIRYIRVAEDIPITVFGYPMPIIERSEFHLPWMPSCEEDTDDPDEDEEEEEDVPYASEEEKPSPDVGNDSCDNSSGGELTATASLSSANNTILPSLSLPPAKESVKQSLLSVLQ